MRNKRDQNDLADLRQEIDAIDDRLADLLVERSGVVARIRDKKRGRGSSSGSVMRPGREAEVVRRMVARVGDAMPARSVVRIWREIISAATRLQSPFRVHILTDDDRKDCEANSRLHFGTLAPIICQDALEAMLEALHENPSDIAVLAIKPGEQREAPWWTRLDSSLSVIAALPMAGKRDGMTLYAVLGQARPEPSGEDATLVVLAHDKKTSGGDLADAIAGTGATLDLLAWATAANGTTRSLGIISGFHPDGSRAIEALRAQARITQADPIGTYALPMEDRELEQ